MLRTALGPLTVLSTLLMAGASECETPASAPGAPPSRAWWKESVIYQIYPRSFQDSNGDGLGDLKGITSRLDYLKELGVDVVWLSPIFTSPNADNGYDISDYRGIMRQFGTMADFDELLKQMKARKLRLILDLVANHSSDEHPWFVESRKSKDNPYRDYYFWRPPRNGKEPNNWESHFTGSAWDLDPQTGEYYLHLFAKKQPDLNWDNPKLRREIYDIMTFWLDKGIDGFRMDVIPFISKNPAFPDFPRDFDGNKGRVYASGPRLHEYLQEMNREVLSKYDIMTVGEGAGVGVEDGPLLVDERRKELNMIYHFDALTLDRSKEDFFKRKPEGLPLPELKAVYARWDRALGSTGWDSVILGNHDFPRMVSRFGDDKQYRVPSSKMLLTLLLTMKGTPYIYQGDELGMTNSFFPTIDDFDDIQTKNAYAALVKAGADTREFLANQNQTSRDHARTPFQWDDSENAGFSAGKPWLRVNANYREINAKREQTDPDSPLQYAKRALRLRKAHLALVYGDFEDLAPAHPQVFAFTRKNADERLLVVLNFSRQVTPFRLSSGVSAGELLLGNYPAPGPETADLQLRPYEARVYRLK